MIEGMLNEVQKEYKEKVASECKKQINPKVTINKNMYLEETHRNCIGGVILTALKNRITVNNTLEARIELAF